MKDVWPRWAVLSGLAPRESKHPVDRIRWRIPWEDLGVNDLGEDFQAVDQSGTGPTEVSMAINRENLARFYGGDFVPAIKFL